jgi:RNA polymerase primary sigma factor
MANKVTPGKRAAKKPAAKAKATAVVASKKAVVAKPAARKAKPAEVVADKPRVAAAKAAAPALAAPPAAKAPLVPAKGRPGRKPKAQNEDRAMPADAGDAVPEAGDDTVDEAVQVAEKMTPRQRAKDRRAKEKALQEALKRMPPGPQEDFEARRNKLKALIKLGKERGFLTYSEINDHLPWWKSSLTEEKSMSA